MLTKEDWDHWHRLLELAEAGFGPTARISARAEAARLLRQEIMAGNDYVPRRLRPDTPQRGKR